MDVTNWDFVVKSILSGLKQISLTGWIAIYGAVLATITLVWGIIKEYKDKPNIKVRYHTGFIAGLGDKTEPIFSINLANNGKRKIIISSLGFYITKDKIMHFLPHNMILSSKLPLEINPYDSQDIYLNIEHIHNAIEKNGEPKYIWVKDKLGKEYRGSTKKLKANVSAMINFSKK
jgi:hypothetical protein